MGLWARAVLSARVTHLEALRPPKGWSTNYEEVHRVLRFEESGLYGKLGFQSRHWIYGAVLPLEHALRVKEKIARSDEVLQALVRFHYQAHTDGSIRAAVFFLCKGLEIAREMPPGRRSLKKEKSLPENVRSALTRTLHEIFGMANYQLETRHALCTKGNSLSLHPSLGSDLLHFVEDVDLILRTVVCLKLGEEPFVVKKGGKNRPI